MLNPVFREWKQDVLESAADRFERRLSEEIGKLRVEMAAMRAELKVEMARMHSSLIRWSFAFWLAQLGAMAMLFRTAGLL